MSAKNNSLIKHTSVSIAQTYQGPIPPAAEMERYHDISSDLPQKIIQMAMDEQKHRFDLENAEQERKQKELEINSTLVRNGIKASIFCVLIIMSASVLCAFFGHPIASGIIGGGGIVVIVSVFVCGSKVKSSNKDN